MIKGRWDPFQAVLQKETNGWVKLAEDEAWARQIMDGFVLIDGAQLGALVFFANIWSMISVALLDAYNSVYFLVLTKLKHVQMDQIAFNTTWCFDVISLSYFSGDPRQVGNIQVGLGA